MTIGIPTVNGFAGNVDKMSRQVILPERNVAVGLCRDVMSANADMAWAMR